MNIEELRDHCLAIKKAEESTPFGEDVPDALIAELIEHSAEEVVKKLPKKRQEEYRCGFIK